FGKEKEFMPRFCTNCGNQLTEAVKFCNKCGTPIGGIHSHPPAPPTQVTPMAAPPTQVVRPDAPATQVYRPETPAGGELAGRRTRGARDTDLSAVLASDAAAARGPHDPAVRRELSGPAPTNAAGVCAAAISAAILSGPRRGFRAATERCRAALLYYIHPGARLPPARAVQPKPLRQIPCLPVPLPDPRAFPVQYCPCHCPRH